MYFFQTNRLSKKTKKKNNLKTISEKVKYKNHINSCLKSSFMTDLNKLSITFKWRLKTILTKQEIL